MQAPAFQLYARDFLADPLVDSMEPEELGGYFRLLLVAWQQDEPGYLPNDPARLASWSRLGRRWKKHGPAIMACFRAAADGRIYQKRMVEVAQEQLDYREQQRQKGIASGAARRANRKRTDDEPEGNTGSTPVQPGFVSGSNQTRTEDEPKVNPASASASAGKALSRAREAQAQPLPLRTLSDAWLNAQLPGLRSADALRPLAEALEAVGLEPVDACKAFRALLDGWKRRNVFCSPTPDKLVEHLGLVQQIAAGEIDPRQIGKPPPASSRGPDETPRPRQPDAREVYVTKFGEEAARKMFGG